MPVRYYRFYKDGYEKESFDYYKQVIGKNDTVIDIGGHIGLNTLAFARLAANGKVYTFEPAPNTFKIIQETKRLNHLDNVEIYDMAISHERSKAMFNIADTDLADNAEQFGIPQDG